MTDIDDALRELLEAQAAFAVGRIRRKAAVRGALAAGIARQTIAETTGLSDDDIAKIAAEEDS
jgi:hypothetical protein